MKNIEGYTFNTFISYRGKLGKLYADSIYSKINYHAVKFGDNQIVPFFAPHDIKKGANFEEIIKKVLPSVQTFIMILTENYFDDIDTQIKEDNMVRMEVETALSYPHIQFIPIIADVNYDYWTGKTFFGEQFTTEQRNRFRKINPIYYSEEYYFDAELALIDAIKTTMNVSKTHLKEFFKSGRTAIGQRIKNDKFLEIEGETERLIVQQKLLQQFDKAAYEKVIEFKPQYILDVGSHNGTALMERLKLLGYNDFKAVIGIDICKSLVQDATKKYASDERIKFYEADIEAVDFPQKIQEIMRENNIESFDFINISSVLLQLEDPFDFLSEIDVVLNENGGKILIVDVDDGLNLAYPDNNQLFAKLFDIYNKCAITGYRKTGRQIYTLLKQATDCSKISFEQSGLNNSTMTKRERRTLFNIILDFVCSAIDKECAENPDVEELQLDRQWLQSNLTGIRDEFFSSDFFFSFGYVIFIAEKCAL